MTPNRRAVIDIGSNSIRLVVYAGSVRSPVPIYNEKSRVSLGACLNGRACDDHASKCIPIEDQTTQFIHAVGPFVPAPGACCMCSDRGTRSSALP